MEGSNRRDLDRELGNLAHQDALARLRAIHEIGKILAAELHEAILQAEAAQVRVARSRYKPAPWAEIGRAIGVTHTQAQRRYKDRIESKKPSANLTSTTKAP